MITRIELQQYRRMTDHHRRSPEAKAFRRRLEAAMDEMPPEYRQIVLLRYCCRLSWRAVGMRMHYSESHVRCYLNKKVIKMLERA